MVGALLTALGITVVVVLFVKFGKGSSTKAEGVSTTTKDGKPYANINTSKGGKLAQEPQERIISSSLQIEKTSEQKLNDLLKGLVPNRTLEAKTTTKSSSVPENDALAIVKKQANKWLTDEKGKLGPLLKDIMTFDELCAKIQAVVDFNEITDVIVKVIHKQY